MKDKSSRPKHKNIKLAHSTLYYSIALGLLAAGLIIAYMIFLMPRLYQAERTEQAMSEVENLHKAFLEKRSYDGLQPSNAYATFSLTLPKAKDEIFIYSKAFHMHLRPLDKDMLQVLHKIKADLGKSDYEAAENASFEIPDLEPFFKQISQAFDQAGLMHLEIDAASLADDSICLSEGETKMLVMDEHSVIVSTRMQAQDYDYMNVLAFTRLADEYVLTLLPLISDRLNPLLPTLLGSLPMVILVLLLALFLASQAYTRRITEPMEALVDHALLLKSRDLLADEETQLVMAEPNSFLEIRQLRESLDELYAELRANYRKLELERERQDLLLRASSHQLKTPVAAALLLLDGMIDKLGSYADTERYLPEVKRKLLSMQQIVSEILTLSQQQADSNVQSLDLFAELEHLCAELQPLAERQQARFRILAFDAEGKAIPNNEGQNFLLRTDPLILEKILDNLLTNALKHSPEASLIELSVKERPVRTIELEIINHEGHIPPELLPHLFEAFVPGTGPGAGHGLGLYLVHFYVKLLGGKISVTNCPEGVSAKLILPKI